MTTTTQLPVHIRWMIRRDMPEVLGIEEANFDQPWTEDEFVRDLRCRNVIAFVAEHKQRIAGFILYELFPKRFEILNFAVHAACQRKGIGTQMIDRLKGKLHPQKRRKIACDVRETNLDALLFFKSQGFQALGIERERYGNEDAIRMEYTA